MAEHRARLHPAVEIVGAEFAQLERRLAQPQPLGMRVLGDARRAVIADVRRQRGDEHQRRAQQRIDAGTVDVEPAHAMVGEAAHRICQQRDAVERVGDDHRLVDIQLELALAGGDDGMDLVRRILEAAPNFLAPEGVLVLEIGNEYDNFIAAFPELEPIWLSTETAEDQILLLSREQLAL